MTIVITWAGVWAVGKYVLTFAAGAAAALFFVARWADRNLRFFG